MSVDPVIKFPDRLYRVLSAHYKSLVQSGSPEDLLDDYRRLLRSLVAERQQHLEALPREQRPHKSKADATSVNVSDLLTVPLDRLEIVVKNNETTRDLLEGVAVQRFSVPKGSLRQYSNKQFLVEKLTSLIDNERTHNTIGEVARRHES